MDKEELLKLLEKFIENKDFKFNPDQKHVDMIINGLIENEKKYGYRYCPCIIISENKKDNRICPCNFRTQPVWETKGMCHCGLFAKR